MPLQRQGVISLWSDADVRPGMNRKEESMKHLSRAQIILLLLSPDFIASEYCFSEELAQVLERHRRGKIHAIPIITCPCSWLDTPFRELQVLPAGARPVKLWPDLDQALLKVVENIREVVQHLTQTSTSDLPVVAKSRQPEVRPIGCHTPMASVTRPKGSGYLPPQHRELLGREHEIERVLKSLRSRSYPICIEGLGGAGKTTLAIEVARACLGESQAVLDPLFEYVVWISAKDRPEQKLWLNEILDTTARVLGDSTLTQVPVEYIEQKKAKANQLLHDHRTLLIIDNFETIDDRALESWIQDIPDPSKVLITSRTNPLRDTCPIDIKGLDTPAALELIRHAAGSLGLETLEAANQEILLPLVQVTGGNPKAIEMALGYIKRGRLSLSEVIEQLQIAGRSVDDVFVYLFIHAWKVMTRNAQNVLLVTPFFAEYASKKALGAATGLTGYHLEHAVGELVELNLLDIKETSVAMRLHYSIHPLTRAFASARPGKRPAARQRWSEYYVDLADRSLTRSEFKECYWNALPPYNRELIDPEWANLQGVLAWAEREGQDQILVDLMLLLTHYMWTCMFFPVRLSYAQKAAEAASRLGRQEDAALLHIDARGWLLLESDRLTDGREDLNKGLCIAQNLEASGIEATELIILAHALLARASLEQGNLAEASALIDTLLPLKCWPITEQHISNTAGDIAYRKKNFSEAMKFYKIADRISIQYGGEGGDIRLGNAYLANGDLMQAEACFREACDRWQHLAVDRIPYAQYGLARVALAKGAKDKARQMAEAVLDALTRTVPSHKLMNEIRDFLQSLGNLP